MIKDQQQKGYHEYHYLIQNHPISYYPSATLLHFERTKEDRHVAPDQAYFGLGVSQFSNTSCTSDGKTYGKLWKVTQSMRQLQDLFGSNQSITIFDDQANEKALKNLDLSRYSYLHFATHGVINTENPGFQQYPTTSVRW